MSGGSIDAHGRPKIGQTLALARRERGLSLKEVEEATKIRATYLGELEKENFDVLPPVYVQGSLKTYANFLHLDGDALVAELKRRQGSIEEHEEPATEELPRGNFPRGRWATLLAGRLSLAEVAEDRGAQTTPFGYLALALALFLTLALGAAALLSTLAWNEEPAAVSEVREPLISRTPEPSSSAATKEAIGDAERPAIGTQREVARSSKDRSASEPGGASLPEASPAGGEANEEIASSEAGAASISSAVITPEVPATEIEVREVSAAPPPASGAPLIAAAPRPARPDPWSPEATPEISREALSEASPAPPDAGAAAPEASGPTPVASAAPAYSEWWASTTWSTRGAAVQPPSQSPPGHYQVRVVVGGADPVQITGSPAGLR